MYQRSISVWFVCKLCRGSFGQVDAFVEHKKEEHFNEFLNMSCIVFEEVEHGIVDPVITNSGDHPLADEINEPLIKIEVDDEDPINPLSSEIIEEPNVDLFEPKSELITYENGIDPEQQEENPYVLPKRLSSEEIQRTSVSQHHSTLLKCEQKDFANRLEPLNSSDVNNSMIHYNVVEKSEEIQPTPTVEYYPTEPDSQFECKLCAQHLESDAELKIHVGICAMHHQDRNRFCVICNKKLCNPEKLKNHRLRFHGTEEEKSSLYKFKCHVCSKQFREANYLSYHLEWHKKKKQQVETSKPKPVKCSHLNCGTAFRCNTELQRHIAAVHLGVRPFNCDFPNCNKTFKQRSHLNVHLRIHTGERPFKCTVDNCDKAFITPHKRSVHHLNAHSNIAYH